MNDKSTQELENVLGSTHVRDFDTFLFKMVDYLKKALIYGHTSRISS